MANKKNSSALSKSIFTIGHHQAPKSQKIRLFNEALHDPMARALAMGFTLWVDS